MAYIKRSIDDELLSWMKDPSRKPLLLRGARQVGKTTAVRALAKRFKYFIELRLISISLRLIASFSGQMFQRQSCGKTLLLFMV
ncbi:AAA family ATPase [Duodenibacillus massiliensis]|uniref:AAA family ATPase n=1 Tax=Duodenibacillus massiliensis TaxID=1852381 RepID=UPI00307E78BA